MRSALFDRRAFIKTAVAACAFAALESESSPVNGTIPAGRLIDVNINLSRWPLRRLRYDDTAALVSMFRSRGVVRAWAGSFDTLLHKDIASVNTRLAEECRRHGRGLLAPFGSINPKSPDWEQDLRRCSEEYRMPGIRLHPNYHGYKLDDPNFVRLLKLAAAHRLIVQLAVLMEDERMMHPLLRVEPVDLAPLATIVKQTPSLHLVLLNAMGKLNAQPLVDLISAGDIYVEISMLEGVGGVSNLLAQVPLDRVLFASNAPLFYFESALLKLTESPLNEDQQRAIRHDNAYHLLTKDR